MRQVQTRNPSSIRPFVLLQHETPPDFDIAPHWDLMIQDGDHLATWRLEFDLFQTAQQAAERIDNHRLDYLTYEGPISGNRGNVRQVDRGEFVAKVWTAHKITGELHCQAIVTAFHLTRKGESTVWNLEHSPIATKSG